MSSWNVVRATSEVHCIGEVADAISALATRCSDSLRDAETLVPVWELSKGSPAIGRAVVQIRVSEEFFDSFFNSPLGYRAMFRRGPRVGCAANSTIVASVRDFLSQALTGAVDAYVITFAQDSIECRGQKTIDRSEYLRSFDPGLAKIWYGTSEIEAGGRVRSLSLGVSADKINVGLSHPWAAIRQDAMSCLLEVKGAFLGSLGLFQLKDPDLRARTLSEKGEA